MNNIQIRHTRTHSRQQGMALVMCLVFLVLLTLISVNAMSSSGLEERMASNTQSQMATFQVVESVISETIDDDPTFVNAINSVSGVSTTHTIGNYTASTTTTLTGAAQIQTGYSIGSFVAYPFSIVAASNNAATGARARNTQGVKRLAPGGN